MRLFISMLLAFTLAAATPALAQEGNGGSAEGIAAQDEIQQEWRLSLGYMFIGSGLVFASVGAALIGAYYGFKNKSYAVSAVSGVVSIAAGLLAIPTTKRAIHHWRQGDRIGQRNMGNAVRLGGNQDRDPYVVNSEGSNRPERSGAYTANRDRDAGRD